MGSDDPRTSCLSENTRHNHLRRRAANTTNPTPTPSSSSPSPTDQGTREDTELYLPVPDHRSREALQLGLGERPWNGWLGRRVCTSPLQCGGGDRISTDPAHGCTARAFAVELLPTAILRIRNIGWLPGPLAGGAWSGVLAPATLTCSLERQPSCVRYGTCEGGERASEVIPGRGGTLRAYRHYFARTSTRTTENHHFKVQGFDNHPRRVGRTRSKGVT